MPSIIEVDTIKNKTGTQNTVLSTDGSGNNTLNAGVIKSNTGSNTGLTIASDGQITVNQNNPTVTLGSNATVASTVSLGLVNHFRPVDNFGHDGTDGDDTSYRTLTLSNNKTYLVFANGYRSDGSYEYWRAMLFTVNGSGAVTTVLNDDPIDSSIPHLVTTGTNFVRLRSGHDSYRLTGVLFEMT